MEAYRAYREGDVQRAQELQEQGAKLIDLAGKYGMQATCKALVKARLGIESGEPRPPISSLSEEQTNQLLDEARAIGVLTA